MFISQRLSQKILTVLGQDFGEYDERKVIVVWALHGLKSTGDESLGIMNVLFGILSMSCRPISLDESNGKACGWI